MKANKKAIDLTQGTPIKQILLFTLPLFLGELFQQLYNVVDTLVVGRFVSSKALGAVGSTFPIIFIAISVSTGLSIGCSVITSRYVGANQYKKARTSINTALMIAFVASIIMTVVMELLTLPLLRWVRTPADTFDMAHSYLVWYFAGTVPTFMYASIASIFRAIGDSKTPFYYLLLSSVTNIVLDLVFVIYFNMGCAGVAIATVIAQTLIMILSGIHLIKIVRALPKSAGAPLYDAKIAAVIFKSAIPSMLQHTVLAVSFIVFQMLVNGFGSLTVSGYTAATKIENFAYIPLMNLGNAAATYTAQNYGAKKVDRIKKGVSNIFATSLIISLVGGVIIYIFAQPLIGFLIGNAEKEIFDTGIFQLQKLAILLPLSAIMYSAEGTLRGIDDMNFVFAATTTGMIIRTIIALWAIPKFGVTAVWVCMGISTFIEGGMDCIRYCFHSKKQLEHLSEKEI